MRLRLLDEVTALGDRGVLLLSMDENAEKLRDGEVITDVRGNAHIITSVSDQGGLFTLYVEKGDEAYFDRLFRDVLVDATCFSFGEDAPCP